MGTKNMKYLSLIGFSRGFIFLNPQVHSSIL